MDAERRQRSHEHEPYCQQVKLDAAVLEGREESRTDLETYRVDEEYQAEVLHERENPGIRDEAEMPHHDADEKYPGRAYGYALEVELREAEPDGDGYREKKYRVCCPADYHTKSNFTSTGMPSSIMLNASAFRSSSRLPYWAVNCLAAAKSPRPWSSSVSETRDEMPLWKAS